METPKQESPGRLVIREAELKDCEKIAAIAKSVNIANYADKGQGFLVYSLSAEGYANRIREGHNVYVMQLEEELIGFCCAVPSQVLKKKTGSDSIYGSAYVFAMAHAEERNYDKFIFADQFVIMPEHENKGFGTALIRRMLGGVSMPIYVDVLEGPIKNPRFSYWKKIGFRKIGEVREKASGEFSSLVPGGELLWAIMVINEPDNSN